MDSPQNSKQLLVMTVQIDEQRSGRIDVFEDDDPELLARDFCIKYNINQRIVPILIDSINKNIMVAHQERQNMEQYLQNKSHKEEVSVAQSVKTQPSPSRPKSVEHKTNPTVYDRLYKDAHRKQVHKQHQIQQQIQYEDSRLKYSQSDINYGLILYQKGLKKKEELNFKAESARKDMQNSQLLECTHHPQINEISKQIARRSPDPVGDHLNRIAKQQTEKRQSQRLEKLQQEQDSCSFHPQINRISAYIVDEKKKQSQIHQPHYESLYQDNEVKKHKIQALDQNYFSQKHTFHPQIDKISDKIVQGTSFQERQTKYRRNSREKSYQDDECVFKPKTGRPPEQRPEDLFKSLYEDAKQQESNKIAKLTQSAEKIQSQSRTKVITKSEQIVRDNINVTLSKLFDQLDNDGDGQIDAIRIDTENIDSKILKIIHPLLYEMEQGHHILVKSEFIESMQRLLQTLSVGEKHQIFRKEGRKSETNAYTFQVLNINIKPAINPKSQKIVASRRY